MNRGVCRRQVVIAALGAGASAVMAAPLRPIDKDFVMSSLSETDRAALAESAKVGGLLLRRHLGKRAAYRVEDIDAAINAWRRVPAGDRESADELIDAFGALLGDMLAAHLDLEWQAYRDKRGEDLCVVHKRLNVFTFPHSSIYKAVYEDRRDALATVRRVLAEQIASGRAGPRG